MNWKNLLNGLATAGVSGVVAVLAGGGAVTARGLGAGALVGVLNWLRTSPATPPAPDPALVKSANQNT